VRGFGIVRWSSSALGIEFGQMSMQPGTRLGPYDIISPLGAGGFGEV